MTAPPAGEPTLAGLRRDYPGWKCAQGISGFCHAQYVATGAQASGEGPLDLQDQIKAAETHLACQQQPGALAPGPAGVS